MGTQNSGQRLGLYPLGNIQTEKHNSVEKHPLDFSPWERRKSWETLSYRDSAFAHLHNLEVVTKSIFISYRTASPLEQNKHRLEIGLCFLVPSTFTQTCTFARWLLCTMNPCPLFIWIEVSCSLLLINYFLAHLLSLTYLLWLRQLDRHL